MYPCTERAFMELLERLVVAVEKIAPARGIDVDELLDELLSDEENR